MITRHSKNYTDCDDLKIVVININVVIIICKNRTSIINNRLNITTRYFILDIKPLK